MLHGFLALASYSCAHATDSGMCVWDQETPVVIKVAVRATVSCTDMFEDACIDCTLSMRRERVTYRLHDGCSARTAQHAYSCTCPCVVSKAL